MRFPALSLRSVFSKAALATLALGGVLFLTDTPAAKANGRDNCNHRVAYADDRCRAALERFGPRRFAARHWAYKHQLACEHLISCRRAYHRY